MVAESNMRPERNRVAAHRSSEEFQPPEADVSGHVGRRVEHEQRDGDEAKVDEKREEIEKEKPLEEEEVGEDAAAEGASDLFHGALP